MLGQPSIVDAANPVDLKMSPDRPNCLRPLAGMVDHGCSHKSLAPLAACRAAPLYHYQSRSTINAGSSTVPSLAGFTSGIGSGFFQARIDPAKHMVENPTKPSCSRGESKATGLFNTGHCTPVA
jgi:hypothetical protein